MTIRPSSSIRTFIRDLRREMKKKDLKVEDMPEDVAQSYLALIQEEQMRLADIRLNSPPEK